jgi:membrane protease YdiL (CAAX protease family)
MKRDKFFELYDIDEKSYSFRGLLLIGYLYFGSLLFSAIVAPLVFRLVHFLDPEAQGWFASKPFVDYFDRGRILCLLILFPLLMKRANLWSWKRLGYLSPGWGHFRKWFSIGIGMMLLVYLIDFGFGVIGPRGEWSWINLLEKAGAGLVGALLIGFAEETFFRGFVFRTFYTAMRPALAVILSSMFFAYLHFKMADEVMAHIPSNEIGIDDGLYAIWGSVTAFTTGFNGLLFFNLCLVGILLHLAFLYSRNLWACVGLHAGWVFVIQTLSKTFNETLPLRPFFGTERISDGYLVTLFLLGFIGIALWLILGKKNN